MEYMVVGIVYCSIVTATAKPPWNGVTKHYPSRTHSPFYLCV